MPTEQPPTTHVPTEPADGASGWRLEEDARGVTARDRRGSPVAHVDIIEEGERVDLVFWFDERLPGPVTTGLAREAFAHPALRPHRPVAAALPQHQADALGELRAHLAGVTTHVAGTTCLVVGQVRGG